MGTFSARLSLIAASHASLPNHVPPPKPMSRAPRTCFDRQLPGSAMRGWRLTRVLGGGPIGPWRDASGANAATMPPKHKSGSCRTGAMAQATQPAGLSCSSFDDIRTLLFWAVQCARLLILGCPPNARLSVSRSPEWTDPSGSRPALPLNC
eukprot:scaffold1644_cov89-Isochrysis_galbana.AAC.6